MKKPARLQRRDALTPSYSVEILALPAPWRNDFGTQTTKVDSPWRDKTGIAHYLGCSVRHITALQKRRAIPFVRFGRFVRFNIHDCDRALKVLELKSVGCFVS